MAARVTGRHALVREIAYTGPRTGVPKQLARLWETTSGACGIAYWTGVYWAVEGFIEPTPAERVAIKRLAARAPAAESEHLGTYADPHAEGLRRWQGRAWRAGSTDQQDYLRRLGVLAPPALLPRPVLGQALSTLRHAQALVAGRGDAQLGGDASAAKEPLQRLCARDWTLDALGFWTACLGLATIVYAPNGERRREAP